MAWPAGTLTAKMGALEFVTALLHAGVVPASTVHNCLGELLTVRRRRWAASTGSARGGLHCRGSCEGRRGAAHTNGGQAAPWSEALRLTPPTASCLQLERASAPTPGLLPPSRTRSLTASPLAAAFTTWNAQRPCWVLRGASWTRCRPTADASWTATLPQHGQRPTQARRRRAGLQACVPAVMRAGRQACTERAAPTKHARCLAAA